jgi:tRNA pseudouridine65 synthase
VEIDIIFEDDDLVAINKPHGLLVHRSNIANDASVFALQLVRDKINKWVYPVHRIDRKTSGVLLFTKSKESLKEVQKIFKERQVEKTYMAIVRGFLEPEGLIDYPLKEGNKTQKATTFYKVKEEFELNLPSGKFATSRYSLLEIQPRTGRFHQIRKHLAHIFHPIIGDRPHGCNKQNKIWKEKYKMTTMMLHASSLVFNYPENNPIYIKAQPSVEFKDAITILNKFNLL